MGLVICGLVKPRATPQRHQARGGPTAAEWPGRGDLPPPRRRLQKGQSATPTLLLQGLRDNGASQSWPGSTDLHLKLHPCQYLDGDCLKGSKGVNFPARCRTCPSYKGSRTNTSWKSSALQSTRNRKALKCRYARKYIKAERAAYARSK